MELLHPCLNVADMDRAVAFYTEELDFTESWSFETPDGETENRYLAAENGVELQLSKTEGVDELEAGTAWDHLAVSVESVDRVFEEIDHHGVVKEPTDVQAAGTRIAFVRDPDGHVIEFVEPLDD
ncbi:VOC family protein [Halococcus qingdaonensis]|uniref:VOC family protein n=1 Tax=Halococcus qingdaonensis TaxID=224402 RepID=UPI002117099C|nr:VOC family protein [Halococcus qingdaonensis]